MVPTAPEAERRQRLVKFCDLAGSTPLPSSSIPEDLREVIRAYQETAAAVIHQYLTGYIAALPGQWLVGLFWLAAGARRRRAPWRASRAGGLSRLISHDLNPRLERDKGVRLAVRIGLHTGPVVVGEIARGGRQENLALGETPNVAARLEGLAAPIRW